jgi:hypothetical protein
MTHHRSEGCPESLTNRIYNRHVVMPPGEYRNDSLLDSCADFLAAIANPVSRELLHEALHEISRF